jgi:uncharacterized membrane protein
MKETIMSELVVLGFETENKADEVLVSLQKMQNEYLIDLEDAAVVYRKADGKVKIKQAHNLVAAGAAHGALGGGLWGMLFGLLFFDPLIGWGIGTASGAAAGAASGALTDIGVDDNFIKELGATLQAGNSALFVLVRKSTPDKVLQELKGVGGKVLRSSLSDDAEATLQKALEGQQA